ncbi:MAG: hypothetical protein AAGD11_10010 [Planctomycetota bacterium]
MRKTLRWLCCLACLSSTGCAVSDVVFGLFGDHYTGGGTTECEKKYHYEQQLANARDASQYVP